MRFVDIDSPDPLSKFNKTSPIVLMENWSSASPCSDSPMQPLPCSPAPQSPRSPSFHPHPNNIPDISSLSVSPDTKPPTARYLRGQARSRQSIQCNPPSPSPQNHALSGSPAGIVDEEQYGESITVNHSTGGEDSQVTGVIDIESREKYRQSKSRVKALQSLSQSKNLSPKVVERIRTPSFPPICFLPMIPPKS